MKAISQIKQWSSDNGYAFMYGNPAHINRMMHDTDYSASAEHTAVHCYLITSADTQNSHDRVSVGVYFSSLCEFDFDPTSLLAVQEELMGIGKKMLASLADGNVVGYEEPVRWQFGYDDFADNVAWVCARVTFFDLSADCIAMQYPTPFVDVDGLAYAVTQAYAMFVGVGDAIDVGCDNIAILQAGDYRVSFQMAITKKAVNLQFTIFGQNVPFDTLFITESDAQGVPILANYVGHYLSSAPYVIPEGEHGETVAEIANALTGEIYSSCEFSY